MKAARSSCGWCATTCSWPRSRRTDLSDAPVADNLAAACAGDAERLRLLYLLTIGDSRATGPAAWSPSNAALLRDLFVKAAAAIERGEARVVAADRREALAEQLGDARAAEFLARLPDAYVLAFDLAQMRAHEELLRDAPAVRIEPGDGSVTVTRDRTRPSGPSRDARGAFTVSGLDVQEANLFGTSDGLKLDVFAPPIPSAGPTTAATGSRRTSPARSPAISTSRRVNERRASGTSESGSRPRRSRCRRLGDRHRRRGVRRRRCRAAVPPRGRLRRSRFDVRRGGDAGVAVIDVFYVRDAAGHKVEDDVMVEELRTVLAAPVMTRCNRERGGATGRDRGAVRPVGGRPAAVGETLRASRTGLGFTQSLYERERFEEVLKVASDIQATAIEEWKPTCSSTNGSALSVKGSRAT